MRVLIGYDGSECARAALDDLKFAGLPPDAEILLLSVVDAWLPPETERSDEISPWIAEIRDSLHTSREAAARGVEQLRGKFPGWRIHAEACADSPAWAIVKRAEGLEGGVYGRAADLVVVGSHGKSGLQRLFLGSVSTTVLTHARCPVRIARPLATSVADSAPPGIVIGVDGSPDALSAVEVVASRSWPEGTGVLIAAFEKGIQTRMASAARREAFSRGTDMRLSARTWAQGAAEEAAAMLRRRGGLPVEIAVDSGEPKQGLIDRARALLERGPVCIFVGARGLRRIARFLLGGVSMSVAMNAPCSVEIVRPHEREL